MWLIFLRKYWAVLAAVVITLSLVLAWSHSRYTAGYTACNQKQQTQHVADIESLLQRETKAIGDLHKAEQALAEERAAKNKALAEASKPPKVLIKVVHDKATNCDIPSIGPDFERVWNAQAEAASTHH